MIDFHDMKAVGDAAEGIHGWWSRKSGERLYKLIREMPNVTVEGIEVTRSPDVVEIGAWCGRSTTWIAAALAARGDGGICYSVDTWKGTPGEHDTELTRLFGQDYDLLDKPLMKGWRENLERLGLYDHVLPLVAGDGEFVDIELVDVLVIDGDHSYEAVLKDWVSWAPVVVPGGYVILDDVPSWPGPNRLHNEIKLSSVPWELVTYWDNQVVFRRSE